MSTPFFIVPAEPNKWGIDTSDLYVDPDALRAELYARWPDAIVHMPTQDSSYILQWQFHHRDEAGCIHGLQNNRQVVSFDGWDIYLAEFVLWYRAYIPVRYHLFFACASSIESDYLEPTSATTEEDIKAYAL